MENANVLRIQLRLKAKTIKLSKYHIKTLILMSVKRSIPQQELEFKRA